MPGLAANALYAGLPYPAAARIAIAIPALRLVPWLWVVLEPVEGPPVIAAVSARFEVGNH